MRKLNKNVPELILLIHLLKNSFIEVDQKDTFEVLLKKALLTYMRHK